MLDKYGREIRPTTPPNPYTRPNIINPNMKPNLLSPTPLQSPEGLSLNGYSDIRFDQSMDNNSISQDDMSALALPNAPIDLQQFSTPSSAFLSTQPLNPYNGFADDTRLVPTTEANSPLASFSPTGDNSPLSLSPNVKGSGIIYDRNKTPGYMIKDGHKNEVANNPGNIASQKSLYYGATGRLVSNYNGEDHADSSLLVYPSAKAGFAAMDQQMRRPMYQGPIKKVFAKWQKKGFAGKLSALRKEGIDTNQSYDKLSAAHQKAMRKVWAQKEGWRRKEYF